MKLGAKIAIFLIAMLVSFIGFSLMASPEAKDMLRTGENSEYEVVAKVVSVRLAECC